MLKLCLWGSIPVLFIIVFFILGAIKARSLSKARKVEQQAIAKAQAEQEAKKERERQWIQEHMSHFHRKEGVF